MGWGTFKPLLADAIVAWKLPMLWMADMCRSIEQNAALRYILEGSGHFDDAPVVQYFGWFNATRLPNPELVCQCTRARRLVTLASDWSENLSFLSRLPRDHARRFVQPPDALDVAHYSSQLT